MENKITHKELLVFSNLTNLEWQFVDLEKEEKGYKDKKSNKTKTSKSTILKDLLKPELFTKKDEEGNFNGYVYMDNVKNEKDITKEDKRKGLQEMRKSAGLGMKCIEDMNGKGKGLEGWEVVYAADNYKIVSEFLDDIYGAKKGEVIVENEKGEKTTERAYLTRAEVEKSKKTSERINFGIKAIMIGSYLVPFCIGLRKAGGFKPLIKGGMDKIEKKGIKITLEKALGISKKKGYTKANRFLKGNMDRIINKVAKTNGINQKTAIALSEEINKIGPLYSNKDISEKIVEELAETISKNMAKQGYKDGVRDLGHSFLKTFKPKELLGETRDLIKKSRETGIASYMFNDLSVGTYTLSSSILEKAKQLEENQSIEEIEELIKESSFEIVDVDIKISQDIVMYDTGFRVLILEKDDKCVIAYKNGKDADDETLPIEFDYLQMVYNKIKKKKEKQEICFTGLDEGADLGMLSSLTYKEKAKLFYTGKPKIEMIA